MGRSVQYACDVGSCDRTDVAPEGVVAPPGWAHFEIVVRSASPLPTAERGGHRSCSQTRSVYCCPEHTAGVLASLPGSQPKQLGGG